MLDICDKIKIYEGAISHYGTQLQSVVALEELSEVQKEICKLLRGCGDKEHLAEEIADAQIMLVQLCMMYDVAAEVNQYIDAKTQRLAERIKAEIN